MCLRPRRHRLATRGRERGTRLHHVLLGICPLAERLEFLTEELAEYTNPTVGGLLNATFGNLTEVIVSVFALRASPLRVVQLSLLGSVLSNTLLVLGCAFLFGGTKRKEQRFNAEGTSMNFGLLMLSALAIALPTLLRASRTELRAGPSGALALEVHRRRAALHVRWLPVLPAGDAHHLFEEKDEDEDDDEEREEESALGFWGCIFWLGVATLFISVLSNYVVDTIDDAAVAANIPVAFIAVIVLPIVGNAAEHASAVMFALKDKLDLSMGVAVGSATQISLLVLPFTVVLGWFLGAPMDLNMELYETVVLLLTVGVVALVCQDGRSDWLKGSSSARRTRSSPPASFITRITRWPGETDTTRTTSGRTSESAHDRSRTVNAVVRDRILRARDRDGDGDVRGAPSLIHVIIRVDRAEYILNAGWASLFDAEPDPTNLGI